MGLRTRIKEMATESNNIDYIEETDIEQSELVNQVSDIETLNNEIDEDSNVLIETEDVIEDISNQIDINNKIIESTEEPSESQVVAVEMALQHYAYRTGLLKNISLESQDIKNIYGELVFESCNYIQVSNVTRIQNVNLALEGILNSLSKSEGLKSVGGFITKIKDWLLRIVNFIKNLFSSTKRAHKFLKENLKEVQDAIKNVDKDSEDYKKFIENFSKLGIKVAKILSGKSEIEAIKKDPVYGFKYTLSALEDSVKFLNEIKSFIEKYKNTNLDYYKYSVPFGEIVLKFKAEAESRFEIKHIHLSPSGHRVTGDELSKIIYDLVDLYEKVENGIIDKLLKTSSTVLYAYGTIADKITKVSPQANISEFAKEARELRSIALGLKEQINNINTANIAINNAIVLVAKYAKKLGVGQKQ